MTSSTLPPALQLRGVRKSFGKTEIIRGTDLVVQSGERVAIIGPNGAGKSTLFNLISGRMPLSGGANVILLDEPTAGMSASETSHFVALIREATEGKTLLTVEHDMGVVFGLADKIAVLVYGEVIAFDTPEAVRADPRVQEAYLGSAVADAQADAAQRRE